ncbi:MAG: heparinase II/III family protein, partial [Paenibacillaceae bacterium]|nr:heparinase II/III family protein [Paenibacillaceae bacterium]
IHVAFEVPADANIGAGSATVSVYSQYDGKTVPVQLNYEVVSNLAVTVLPPDDGYKLGTPGATIVYKIRLNNRSTVQATTYEVHLPGETGSLPTGTLEPLASAEVSIPLPLSTTEAIGSAVTVAASVYSSLDRLTLALPLKYVVSGSANAWKDGFEYANAPALNSRWSGLDLATDPAFVKEGGASAKWYNTQSRKTVKTSVVPKDWSRFDHVQFWMYAVQATGDKSYLFIDTDDPSAAGADYYLYSYTIDWTGWKQFDIPLSSFTKVRQASWTNVKEFRFTSFQYATDTPSPATVLYIDDWKVYGQTFEAGPSEIVKRALPGENVDFYVQLTNRSDVEDAYTIEVPETLEGDLVSNELQGTLAPGERKMVALQMPVPAGQPAGETVSVTLAVYSTLADHAFPVKLTYVTEQWQPGNQLHPNTLYNAANITNAKQNIQSAEWAKAYWSATKAKADEWLTRDTTVPSESGGHYFVTPAGYQLLYDPNSPYMHYSPDENKYYTGFDYDSGWRYLRNKELAAAAKTLAIAYAITDDTAYAGKVKEILLGYARYYANYALQASGGRMMLQTLDEAETMIEISVAYDLIYESGVLSDSNKFNIERNFMYPSATTIHAFDMDKNNWQTWQNTAVGIIGLTIGDSELVEQAINGAHGFHYQMDESVLPDGFWWEGSIAYHLYALKALIMLAQAADNGGYSLYDAPSLKKMVLTPIRYAYPDLSLPANNDGGEYNETLLGPFTDRFETAYAHYKDATIGRLLSAKYADDPLSRAGEMALFYGDDSVMPDNSSRNFTSVGHAILKSGKASELNYVLMDYGPTGGYHGHEDKLHIDVYGKNKLLAPDLGTSSYSHPYYQEWYRKSIAHNTVVVDGVSQQREIEQDGTLREVKGDMDLFLDEPDFRLMRASAAEAYADRLDRYERTVWLQDDYALDWFEAAGTGESHTFDWVLHGLGDLTTDLTLQAREQKLANTPGYDKLKNVRSVLTEQKWEAEWEQNGTRLRLVSLPDQATEVVAAEAPGPAIGLMKDTPLIIQRQTGSRATFVSVLQPFAAGDTKLQAEREGGQGVRIDRSNRSDHLYYRPDAPAGSLLAGKGSSAVGTAFDFGQHVASELVGQTLHVMVANTESLATFALLLYAPHITGVTLNGNAIAPKIEGDYVIIDSSITAGLE